MGGVPRAARRPSRLAHAGADDRRRILGSGFDDILIKPITLARLMLDIRASRGPNAPLRQAAPAAGEEDAAAEFTARFGRPYDAHLADFCAELDALLEQVDTAASPTRTHRETAHRLAGSAALLGLPRLHRGLQALEGIDGQDWTSGRSGLLGRLRQARAADLAPSPQ